MILPIIKYGASVLRNKASVIDKGDDFENLSANMFETLKKAQGIGLAGPQVNVLKNMFVIDTTPFDDGTTPKIEKAFFNPEILHFSDENENYEEGCLSIPGIFESVIRPSSIEVRYRDINFDIKKEKIGGIEARIFQHEYDHLEGILFIDRIHKLRRKLINKKLQKIVIGH
ncbi:MAG: peptide deformylase [Prolixibacteraceae bacterium]|jgi:peptide deformylase|nr:peptide deformylase [Prolixibacteraceae bacterium]